jgi:hypothetical protein
VTGLYPLLLHLLETGGLVPQRGRGDPKPLYDEFPGIVPNLTGIRPHYKVYVGNFRTPFESPRQLKSISEATECNIVENTPLPPDNLW